MTSRDAGELIRQTFNEWLEDKVLRLGAALAYYSIFTIPPLIVIVLGATHAIYKGYSGTAMETQLAHLIGTDTARSLLQANPRPPGTGHGTVATVFGLGMLLFGATGVIGSLTDALNTIWEVRPRRGQGFFRHVRARFFSLAMIFGMTFMLMVSLVLSAVISGLTAWMVGALPGGDAATLAVEVALSFVASAVLFAIMFKTVPDVKLVWKDVLVGAIVTAALFAIGKFVIGFYLGKATVSSQYGAAAPLVVLILWVYYSAQILLFGAEFTQVYANKYGSRCVPAENAEPVTEEKRAQEGLDAYTPEREARNDGGHAALR